MLASTVVPSLTPASACRITSRVRAVAQMFPFMARTDPSAKQQLTRRCDYCSFGRHSQQGRSKFQRRDTAGQPSYSRTDSEYRACAPPKLPPSPGVAGTIGECRKLLWVAVTNMPTFQAPREFKFVLLPRWSPRCQIVRNGQRHQGFDAVVISAYHHSLYGARCNVLSQEAANDPAPPVAPRGC